MSYIRSCHSINAKCALLPLIDTLIDYRKKTKKLGQIGPCLFEDPEIFLKKADQVRRHTHIKIIDGQQVVAIGDIHGDFLVLLGVLFLMNVIDVTGNWIGNNTIVVLCGDVLDRSGRTSSPVTNNSREEVDIVQYLYALNKQAFKSNGSVNWVLGNHDIARVLFKKYSYEQYIGNQSIGWGGEQNMKKLFEPTGYMAKYLAYNTTFILKVGDFVFLHGGITLDIIKNIKKDLKVRTESPKVQNFVFEKMNSHVRDCFTKKNFELNKNIENIAWDRSLSDVPKCTKDLQKIFKEVNMNWEKSAFVVGHTVQHNGIEPYCEGRVWRIDLGMSEAFDGSKTITKVVGGIKIFQYPTQDRPFEVLSIMNYAKDNIYKFLWFIKKSYNNRYEIQGNLQGKWLEDIKQTHIKEVKNTKKTQSIKVLNINDSLFASKKHPGNELLEFTESNEKKLNESCVKQNLSWFGNYKVAKQYETSHSEFKMIGPTMIDFDTRLPEEGGKCVLEDLCKFDLARFIRSKKTKIGVVFNLDKHDQSGSHWVSLFIDIENKFLFFFDSADNAIPREIWQENPKGEQTPLVNRIIEQGKTQGIEFRFYNNKGHSHQNSNTECGMYSLFFIITMLTGETPFTKGVMSIEKRRELFLKKRIPDKTIFGYRKLYFND